MEEFDDIKEEYVLKIRDPYWKKKYNEMIGAGVPPKEAEKKVIEMERSRDSRIGYA